MGVVARGIAMVGLVLLASACASGPPGRGLPPGFSDDDEGGPPPNARAQLFISPSGQPFRAPGGQAYPSAAWFAAADRDHDGRITRDEFRADAETWFKVLDEDGDGQIGMPEVTRWEDELVPELTRLGLGLGGSGGRSARGRNELRTRSQGAAAFSLINEPHPIRGADANFDYKVSRAEWRAAADRRFALLDADGDGAVLVTDLRPTPAQGRSGDRRTTQRPDTAGPRPRS